MNQRLIAEREFIRANLDLEAIEALAAESQALIDRAMETALVASPTDVIDAPAEKLAGRAVVESVLLREHLRIANGDGELLVVQISSAILT